jgi:2-dehydropantoate 2-reductase
MRRNGLKIELPDGELHVRVRAYHLCDVATFTEPFDVVLLVLKAYDTRWACEMIKPHLAPDGMLIGMQNGMVADVIRDVVGPQRTIGCVIELSSEMFMPGQVKRNTPPQRTWIGLGILDGGPEQRLAEMRALLTPVGKVEIKPNILAAKWSKLVVNAMCLGPCAMVGLTISDAVQLSGMRELIVEIGNEAMQAGQDLGYPLEPIFGLTQADLAGSNSPAEKMFDTLAGHIGPGRGRNTVLQDFLKGRASEVSMINGLVVEESERRGRTAPANARIAEISRQIEAGTLKPSPDNLEMALSLPSRR